MKNKGMVYVFTGEGKGKTSAALGVGVRAALRGMEVGMVQWYKEKRWPVGEHKIEERISNFKVYALGSGFYKLPTDHATPKEHKQAAEEALKKAGELIDKLDVLILDEINNAVKDKLVKEEDLLRLLEKRGKTHVILTGRRAARRVLAGADLVTECKKIKHPFDKGVKAIRGLDF